MSIHTRHSPAASRSLPMTCGLWFLRMQYLGEAASRGDASICGPATSGRK